jgi:8-oxo-dGTP pyrophosphatase MutT (NUDIX family)
MMPWKNPQSETLDQACAVPYRHRQGRLELCLVTTSAKRWTFPKGNIDPGDTPADTAIKEALEEAGLHGRIVGEPLGLCELEKSGRKQTVVVWLMKVERCDAQWEECDMRQRRWVSPKEARRLFSREAFQHCLDAAVVRLRAA